MLWQFLWLHHETIQVQYFRLNSLGRRVEITLKYCQFRVIPNCFTYKNRMF